MCLSGAPWLGRAAPPPAVWVPVCRGGRARVLLNLGTSPQGALLQAPAVDFPGVAASPTDMKYSCRREGGATSGRPSSGHRAKTTNSSSGEEARRADSPAQRGWPTGQRDPWQGSTEAAPRATELRDGGSGDRWRRSLCSLDSVLFTSIWSTPYGVFVTGGEVRLTAISAKPQDSPR